MISVINAAYVFFEAALALKLAERGLLDWPAVTLADLRCPAL